MAEYIAKTPDNKCVFCEIVAGRLDSPGIFWQDDNFMAFLSIDPNTPGFTCVIPKAHFGSDVLKMPDETLQTFVLAAKTVATILENYFDDVGRIGVMMEGTGIDHAHIKLMPLHGTEHLKRGEWRQILSGKEFWFDTYEGWIASGGGPMANPAELKQLATRLKESQN